MPQLRFLDFSFPPNLLLAQARSLSAQAERQAARPRAALAAQAQTCTRCYPLCKPACTPCPRPRSPGGCGCFLLPHTTGTESCWPGRPGAAGLGSGKPYRVAHARMSGCSRAVAGHAAAVLACDSHDRHKFWCCKFTCCKSSDGSAESPRSR